MKTNIRIHENRFVENCGEVKVEYEHLPIGGRHRLYKAVLEVVQSLHLDYKEEDNCQQ